MTRTCTDVSAFVPSSRGVEVGRDGVEVGFSSLRRAGVEVG